MPRDLILLGNTDFRKQRRMFGIRREDRFAHLYAIGKTGTGKSTLLETIALQDMANGNGFALIDPHGDLADRLAARAADIRSNDLIYLNAADRNQVWGYNPLRHVGSRYIALAASGLMEVFKKLWPDAWGVRMEHVLRNTLMALLEQPNATLPDILKIFSDKKFRRQIARSLKNEVPRRFLETEYERFSFGYRADAVAPIQNKVGAFLADPLLAGMLTEPRKQLRLRQIMDEGKVLIVNLAKGLIGEDSASLLGSLLVTTIGLAAHTRADTPSAERRDFFLHIDELQSFVTLSLANMLSELRKYRVGISAVHQYLQQITPDIRHSIFGNVGTIISFRIGAEDASYLAREFQDEFTVRDLVTLANHRIYLKLMIDGTPSKSFSAQTLHRV